VQNVFKYLSFPWIAKNDLSQAGTIQGTTFGNDFRTKTGNNLIESRTPWLNEVAREQIGVDDKFPPPDEEIRHGALPHSDSSSNPDSQHPSNHSLPHRALKLKSKTGASVEAPVF
jgi:hypothetical protein